MTMLTRMAAVFIMALITAMSCGAAEQAPQSRLNPAKAQEARKYPRIVAYTVSWCPHCREVKEYLTRNNIPFINRDVEIDNQAMEELTGKYNSQGVPVVVIVTGKDEIVLKGFTAETFETALKRAQSKK
jgi:glutaredoxin-like YruB-family protein